MSDRLTDEQVQGLAGVDASRASWLAREIGPLAREVQASRKLIADLRARHHQRKGRDFDWCNECQIGAFPCPTIRLIEGAGL